MDTIIPQDFYTYTLTNSLTGNVFYVGKGRGYRMHEHEWEAKRGGQSPKCDIIRQILAKGGSVIATKVNENLSSEDAYLLESRLIKSYGIENLTNRTLKGNQNARGKKKPFKKQLVQVGVSVSGMLRDQIEACMEADGIAYSKETCYQYVKDICHQALLEHVSLKFPDQFE